MSTKSRKADEGLSRLEVRRRKADKASNPSYNSRREEVLLAAARLFAEKGYEATALSDVADAVGMDRATLYYYFKSKDELLGAAMTAAFAVSASELDRIMRSDDDAIEKLRQCIRMVLKGLETSYPLGTLYFQDGIWRSGDSAWIAPVRRVDEQMEVWLLKVIAQGQEEGLIRDDIPVPLVKDIVFGSAFWAYRWFKPGCAFGTEDVCRSFEAILLDGIRARGRSRAAASSSAGPTACESTKTLT